MLALIFRTDKQAKKKKTKKQTEAQSRNFNVKLVFTFGNVSLNSFFVWPGIYAHICMYI